MDKYFKICEKFTLDTYNLLYDEKDNAPEYTPDLYQFYKSVSGRNKEIFMEFCLREISPAESKLFRNLTLDEYSKIRYKKSEPPAHILHKQIRLETIESPNVSRMVPPKAKTKQIRF